MSPSQLRTLGGLLVNYGQLKMPLFGYLFRGGQVREVERQLNALPISSPLQLKQRQADVVQPCRGGK